MNTLSIQCFTGNPTYAPCDLSLELDSWMIVGVVAVQAFCGALAIAICVLGGR